MGLSESRRGEELGNIPSPEIREAVRERIKKTITTLLKNGGAITNSGKIVTFNYSLVNTSRLTNLEIQSLALTNILTVPSSKAEVLFKQSAVRAEMIHIITPNTLGRLEYQTGKNEATFIWVQGLDSAGNIVNYYNGRSFQGALTRYADRVLSEEKLRGFLFPAKKYTGKILREIADEHGLGYIAKAR